jgi:hypothetical protein
MEARREGERRITQVQTGLDAKISDFKPNQNLALPQDIIDAAKSS